MPVFIQYLLCHISYKFKRDKLFVFGAVYDFARHKVKSYIVNELPIFSMN